MASAQAAADMVTTQYYGTGRRKSAVARVFLRPGEGAIRVNAREIGNYFPNPLHQMTVRQPMVLTETLGKFDIHASVAGGGPAGQAGAVRLGVARALLAFNGELRGRLRAEGLLTRDPRAKERKKYGQPGARKRFQFSKR